MSEVYLQGLHLPWTMCAAATVVGIITIANFSLFIFISSLDSRRNRDEIASCLQKSSLFLLCPAGDRFTAEDTPYSV